jgi:AcrR family transcriptional regulator
VAQSRGRRAEIADPDRVIDAMVALVEAQGWRRVSLAGIAEEAGLPILQIYRLFPSRNAVLCGFMRRVDEAALGSPLDTEAGEKPRDRLFDLLMRRFDALTPHRTFIAALRRDLRTDPLTAAALAGAGLRSMRLMLDTAGIASHGIAGLVAVKLTAAAYLAAAHTWSRDESADLAPTMATLDRRLRGIERWLVPLLPPSRYAAEADA